VEGGFGVRASLAMRSSTVTAAPLRCAVACLLVERQPLFHAHIYFYEIIVGFLSRRWMSCELWAKYGYTTQHFHFHS